MLQSFDGNLSLSWEPMTSFSVRLHWETRVIRHALSTTKCTSHLRSFSPLRWPATDRLGVMVKLEELVCMRTIVESHFIGHQVCEIAWALHWPTNETTVRHCCDRVRKHHYDDMRTASAKGKLYFTTSANKIALVSTWWWMVTTKLQKYACSQRDQVKVIPPAANAADKAAVYAIVDGNNAAPKCVVNTWVKTATVCRNRCKQNCSR